MDEKKKRKQTIIDSTFQMLEIIAKFSSSKCTGMNMIAPFNLFQVRGMTWGHYYLNIYHERVRSAITVARFAFTRMLENALHLLC
jgi:hypothetical protein